LALKIIKFGGSSIADAEKIRHVANIVKDKKKDDDLVIVISALGGVTDTLKNLAETAASGKPKDPKLTSLVKRHRKCIQDLCLQVEIDDQCHLDKYFSQLESDLSSIAKAKQLSSQLQDKILSYGELLSTTIIAKYLSHIGIAAEQLDARNVILTDNNFGHAYVHYRQSYDRIRTYCRERTKVQVITGFLGATENGITTTLGRNGSDYTASIFGAALHAQVIEIWTDVDGILSADPNIVKQAKTVPTMTYEEAMELAHAGAKVIFPPSMIPALYQNIPIYIKNTFDPEQLGTRIGKDRANLDEMVVGISSLSNISLVLLQGAGLVSLKGTIGRIFSSLANESINIILISMAFSEHSVCFAIKPKYNAAALRALKTEFETEIEHKQIDRIKLEKKLSLVAVVGEGMRHTPGISGKLFSVLGEKNVNVIAIAQGSSERNISFIIKNDEVKSAIRSLHQYIFSDNAIINVFIAGVGLVGSDLIKLIQDNNSINVCGIINSRKMILNPSGLDSQHYVEELENGDTADLESFISSASQSTNAVFVDVTSSPAIAEKTANILKKRISVVSASKLANAGNQDYYDSIRENSKAAGALFKYETNVGAGLPIIETLQTLLNTGDTVEKIEGIMSGTLSYLFSQFDDSIPFSELVKRAQENGYTEPDPRDDLNGVDVGRKILILARETGAHLEFEDVFIQSLIPENMDPAFSIDEFLEQLSKYDDQFLNMYTSASREDKVLRYIATWDGQNATVELKAVGIKNPFYHQNGRENFIVFTTKRYKDTPMIIKGHGAGAEVTAAGVLGDILKCQ